MSRAKDPVRAWFKEQGWTVRPFQRTLWDALHAGHSGLLNAPTGTGKTYAIWGGVVRKALSEKRTSTGLRAIWITPLRALAPEIAQSAQRLCDGVGLEWQVAQRTGDTSTRDRNALRKKPPQLLVTTPESLHVLLAGKEADKLFAQLDWFIADEWHELLGTKRGVQVELALSYLRGLRPQLSIWGLSATIGNLPEAMQVLLGPARSDGQLVRANEHKRIRMHTLLPDRIERFPWAGHMGLRMAHLLPPLIAANEATLIFTNTRRLAEAWYHRLLEIEPDLAGTIALHHGSLDRELRQWVEDSIGNGILKAVICTSSLDLGVDFKPVDAVVQIGGPKGIARFVQRAGRSGHRPGATSTIHFLPTHALELVEASALRQALERGDVEEREPLLHCHDVLAQYLITIAVGPGLDPDRVLAQVRDTHCFNGITDDEWQALLTYITQGGPSLTAYDEFRKVVRDEDGIFRVHDRRSAMRHRLSIGTIVSDGSITVTYPNGKRIGSIEEYFIAQLRPGDVFWFAGKALEFVRLNGLTAHVHNSTRTKARIPGWQGGRLPLSSTMANHMRAQLDPPPDTPEMRALAPVLAEQRARSLVPAADELLIERFKSRDGHHAVVYPFEGRIVHEAMATLLAFRMTLLAPITISIAMNDHGFELLSDAPLPVQEALDNDLFTTTDLLSDLERSMNATTLARRKFRDIASISGLVFRGLPGKAIKERHLRADSNLFFDVFMEHEPGQPFLLQAYTEAFDTQIHLPRVAAALERIGRQRIVITDPGKFTPFAFPIIVDRMRERLTSEQLEDRIRKMIERLEAP